MDKKNKKGVLNFFGKIVKIVSSQNAVQRIKTIPDILKS